MRPEARGQHRLPGEAGSNHTPKLRAKKGGFNSFMDDTVPSFSITVLKS